MEAVTSSPDNSTLLLLNDSARCEAGYVTPFWLFTVIPAYIYSISALGILLNLLVLLVFLFHKKPCTATEIYLSNMAAADLFLVMFLPFWGKYVSSGLNWTFGASMCKIVTLLIVLNFNCSIYFLVLVSIDRYLALVHPLLQCKLRRRKYAKVSCVVVWVSGLLLNIPTLTCRQAVAHNKTAYHGIVKYTCHWTCSQHVYSVSEIIQTVVGFIIPLLIISFCTVKIVQALKERPKEGISNQNGERKVTFLILAVLLAFLICWLPHRVWKKVELAVRYEMIKESCTLVRVIEICQNFFIYLGFFNSDINPVLYVIVGKNFRKKMLEVLTGRSSVRKSSTTTSMSILSPQKLQVKTNGIV